MDEDVLKSLMKKLEELPCTQHLERLTIIEATLKQMDANLTRLMGLVSNGDQSLSTAVSLLRHKIKYLEEWKANLQNEQQIQRRMAEQARSRGRWQLLLAVVAGPCGAFLAWLLTK